MVVASKAPLQKVGDFLLENTPSMDVRNLGVIRDLTLSYQSHFKSITKSAFFHLQNISRLRPSFLVSVAETLVHAFVTSRLDYCNRALFGVRNKHMFSCQSSHSHQALEAHHPHP